MFFHYTKILYLELQIHRIEYLVAHIAKVVPSLYNLYYEK